MLTLPFDLALRCAIIHSDGESHPQKDGRSHQQGSHADGCGDTILRVVRRVCVLRVSTHTLCGRGLKKQEGWQNITGHVGV